MVKIIWGISGEGNGHATRSWAVMQDLKKKHDITALSSKNAYRFISKKHKDSKKITDLYLHYKNNRVTLWGTLWVNLKNAKKVFHSLKKTYRLFDKVKPGVVINDFSAITTAIALIKRVPIIAIDNNQFVLKTELDIPRKWRFSAIRAKIAIRLMTPTVNWRIIPTFFFPKLKSPRATLIAPIIRKEIRREKPGKKKHVVVYQTSDSNKELLKVLSTINEEFRVYGFNKNKKIGKVKLKEFSEKGFIEDLKNAKAVIMNGGFSLISECLYLKKPIFAIPIEGQIEQMMNARYIQRMKFGKYSDENDKEELVLFLKNLKYFEKNIKKVKFDYDEYHKEIEKRIRQFTKVS